jgi:cobalt-zinc-cadmium efflux system membrane fusion protein
MKLYTSISAIFVIMVLLTSGCGKSSKNNQEAAPESDNLIQVTVQQFDADSMKFGEIAVKIFDDEVSCNGYIMASPSGEARISASISGIVESINCSVGEYVRKGQTICRISSSELLVIQQEFTETSAKLKRLKSDYERSKSLMDEKIGAEKDFIAIESEYKAMFSKYHSLKLRLQLLKLDVSKIEKGELYGVFPVISPISGSVTGINMVLGQFVEQQMNLVEIIDVSQLQLQLSVFENDISKLKPGQNIQFNSLGSSSPVHSAKLSAITKTINPETKTILCLAKINSKDKGNLVNNSYIEARIKVDQKTADALPSEAILKSGKEYYVFVLDKSDAEAYYLRKVKVEIGKVSNGYTEITSQQDITKVLVKGVYNLPV